LTGVFCGEVRARALLFRSTMKKLLLPLLVIGSIVAQFGCAVEDEDDVTDEETEVSSEAITTIDVAPALRYEFDRIRGTPTGRDVVDRARARGLRIIKVGPLPGTTVGLYQSNGVITIESPNNVYTFQRLAHELLHASGNHPHYFPDKGLIGKMCAEARAACPSWN
jgi:hypothetical protein